MKNLITIFLFSLITIIANSQVTNYSVGDDVADFTVTDIEGNVHTLHDYTNAGKYVYIDFFYTTCGPCQDLTPIFNEFYDKYGCNEGEIICISMNSGADNDAAVIAFEETYGGDFNHSVAVSNDGGGGAVTSTFGVSLFPTICLIGPDSKLKENDIWPISSVATFENVFPTGFEPDPMECSATYVEAIASTEIKPNVFPNPASKYCNISYNYNMDMSYSVKITNILGQEVYKNNIQLINATTAKLNTSSLDKGLYILQIFENNTQVVDLKLYIK